jgi:hypothetical protein
MGRIKTCGGTCHNAKGDMCRCWCGGTFHGKAGAVNREALAAITSEPDKLEYLTEHGFISGESKYKEQIKMKKIEKGLRGKLSLFTPAPDLCQICGTKHTPNELHNCQSAYYQTSFFLKKKRQPTWRDAMAHCSKRDQKHYIEELTKMGVKID